MDVTNSTGVGPFSSVLTTSSGIAQSLNEIMPWRDNYPTGAEFCYVTGAMINVAKEILFAATPSCYYFHAMKIALIIAATEAVHNAACVGRDLSEKVEIVAKDFLFTAARFGIVSAIGWDQITESNQVRTQLISFPRNLFEVVTKSGGFVLQNSNQAFIKDHFQPVKPLAVNVALRQACHANDESSVREIISRWVKENGDKPFVIDLGPLSASALFTALEGEKAPKPEIIDLLIHEGRCSLAGTLNGLNVYQYALRKFPDNGRLLDSLRVAINNERGAGFTHLSPLEIEGPGVCTRLDGNCDS